MSFGATSPKQGVEEDAPTSKNSISANAVTIDTARMSIISSAATLCEMEADASENKAETQQLQPDTSQSGSSATEDGGTRAWIQVLGSFIIFFNLWGYGFAFGLFQNYYESDYLRGTSASAISWIGSTQSFLLVICGVFAGPLFDLGYFKLMLSGGALLTTLGAVLLSFSKQYWQLLLTQGICVGLGCGLMFTPSVAFVSRNFVKRRSLAIGIMSSGAPVGAVIYSFIFEKMLPKYDFAWTARGMAAFMVLAYLISIPLVVWRTKNTNKVGVVSSRTLVDKTAFKDMPFWAYAAANATMFMAYLTPYTYTPSYAQTKLGTSPLYASKTLIIAQVASVPGRLGAAVVADHFGVMNPWIICGIMSGGICLFWIISTSVSGFTTFYALYGFFGGALVPLSSSAFPAVCPDRSVLGARLGMAQSISSIMNLIGSPIAGALLGRGHKHSRSWLPLQLWCGCALLFSVALIFLLRALLARQKSSTRFECVERRKSVSSSRNRCIESRDSAISDVDSTQLHDSQQKS